MLDLRKHSITLLLPACLTTPVTRGQWQENSPVQNTLVSSEKEAYVINTLAGYWPSPPVFSPEHAGSNGGHDVNSDQQPPLPFWSHILFLEAIPIL